MGFYFDCMSDRPLKFAKSYSCHSFVLLRLQRSMLWHGQRNYYLPWRERRFARVQMAMGEDFKTPGVAHFYWQTISCFFSFVHFWCAQFHAFVLILIWVWINTFLGEWTSIYQLFWCSPGVQGFDPLPYISTVFLILQIKHRLTGENNSSAPAKLLRLCCRSSSSTEFWDPSGAVPVHDQKWAAQHCSVRKHQGVFLVNDSLI
jgi:hypothetical protein